MPSAFQLLPDEVLTRILSLSIPPPARPKAFDARSRFLLGASTLCRSLARASRLVHLRHLFFDSFIVMSDFIWTYDHFWDFRRTLQNYSQTLRIHGREMRWKESVYITEEVLKRLASVRVFRLYDCEIHLTSLSIAADLETLLLVDINLDVDPPSSVSLGPVTLHLPKLKEITLIEVSLKMGSSVVPLTFFLNPHSLPSLVRLVLVYSDSASQFLPICSQLTHLYIRRTEVHARFPLPELEALSRSRNLSHLSINLYVPAEVDLVADSGVLGSIHTFEMTEPCPPVLERKLLGRSSVFGNEFGTLIVRGFGSTQEGEQEQRLLRGANRGEAEKSGFGLLESSGDDYRKWFNLTKALSRLENEGRQLEEARARENERCHIEEEKGKSLGGEEKGDGGDKRDYGEMA